jgi:hypothetical protein
MRKKTREPSITEKRAMHAMFNPIALMSWYDNTVHLCVVEGPYKAFEGPEYVSVCGLYRSMSYWNPKRVSWVNSNSKCRLCKRYVGGLI